VISEQRQFDLHVALKETTNKTGHETQHPIPIQSGILKPQAREERQVSGKFTIYRPLHNLSVGFHAYYNIQQACILFWAMPKAVLSSEQFETLKRKTLDGIFYVSILKLMIARSVAYCPYSKFRVGCAILTVSGDYIIG
jgi:hypothetical protein